MCLNLHDSRYVPYVALTRQNSQIIQAEMEKFRKNEVIRESNSSWAASCSTVQKIEVAVRVIKDFQGL